jgi:hypothetical protein
MKIRFILPLLCLLELPILMLVLEPRAYAYVDPGSGLLIFQVGGSMLAGAYLVLRQKVHKIFRLGRPKKESTSKENQVTVNEASPSDPSRRY